jgi:hypothetical protein
MTTTLGDVLGALSKQFDSTEIYYGASLGFLERTADATEATAVNTADALLFLSQIARGSGGSGADEALGRRMQLDRRLRGISTV